MSFADIRRELVLLLKSVEGIGRIHDRLRNFKSIAEVLREADSDGRLHLWEVTRINSTQVQAALGNAAGNEPLYHDNHNLSIRGYMAHNEEDEAEKIFQDVVDRVIVKLRQNNQINGTTFLPMQPQLTVMESRMHASVLVWFANISFLAIERVGG